MNENISADWQATARARAVQLSAQAESCRARVERLIAEQRDLTIRIRTAEPEVEQAQRAAAFSAGRPEHAQRVLAAERTAADLQALRALRSATSKQLESAQVEHREAARLANEAGDLLDRLGLGRA